MGNANVAGGLSHDSQMGSIFSRMKLETSLTSSSSLGCFNHTCPLRGWLPCVFKICLPASKSDSCCES